MRFVIPGLLASMLAACAQTLPGPGPTTIEATTPEGEPVLITGIISKPTKGEEPYPAAVLLPSCEGISPHRDKPWVNRLTSLGFVTLQVDSFTARGYKEGVCRAPAHVSPPLRARDALAAKALLAQLPYVDPENIILVGWAHGAWSTLIALGDTSALENEEPPDDENAPEEQAGYVPPFKAGIAFYPWCEPATTVYVPLLILAGELDDWTPVVRCIKMKQLSPAPIDIEIYADAYHDFDVRGRDRVFDGHRLKYDKAATEQAAKDVEVFIRSHIDL